MPSPVDPSSNGDLLNHPKAAGLGLSSGAEEAAALARPAHRKFDAEVAQACLAHDY